MTDTAVSPESTDVLDEQSVVHFDFRNPTTMSRDHVRTLQIVQENLARGLSSTLAAALRGMVNVDADGIEQLPYDAYVRGLPNPSMLTTVSLSPSVGESLVEIPLPLAFAAAELMLGGQGSTAQPQRAMTDLERSLMRSVVGITLPVIRDAFEPVVGLRPSITRQESNPLFAQLTGPTEMVVLISFEIKVENARGRVRMCIPFPVLQPHLDGVSDRSRRNSQSPDKVEAERQRLLAHVSDADVEAVTRFHPLVASSKALLDLGVGDVMLLNHTVDVPLTVEVGGVPIHEVSIGRVNRQYAVCVTGAADPGRHVKRHRIHVVQSSAAAT